MKTRKVNALKSRIISIEEKDVKKAICQDHQQCVIAKAVKRITRAEWVDVSASTVLIKRFNQNKVTRYLLDKKAQEQVRFFDTKGQFAPCLLTLKAPPKVTNLRNKNARSGKSGRHNKSLATR